MRRKGLLSLFLLSGMDDHEHCDDMTAMLRHENDDFRNGEELLCDML